MPPLLQWKNSSYKNLLLRQTLLGGALLEGIQRCCASGRTPWRLPPKPVSEHKILETH